MVLFNLCILLSFWKVDLPLSTTVEKTVCKCFLELFSMLPWWSILWYFLALALMAMKMPVHSFNFVMEKVFYVSTGNIFCNFIYVWRMEGSGQEITSYRLEGPMCKEWPANKLPKCWETVGILLGWSLQETQSVKLWTLHQLLWAGQSVHYLPFKMEM